MKENRIIRNKMHLGDTLIKEQSWIISVVFNAMKIPYQ